jgi:hypothetical protein
MTCPEKGEIPLEVRIEKKAAFPYDYSQQGARNQRQQEQEEDQKVTKKEPRELIVLDNASDTLQT